jgi:uncharacterized membrane protein
LNVSAHPYREPELPSAPTPAASAGVARDDLVVAVLLLVVGVLGVLSGLSMDRQTQLTLGLVLIAFAVKVGWDARRTGHS